MIYLNFEDSEKRAKLGYYIESKDVIQSWWFIYILYTVITMLFSILYANQWNPNPHSFR